MGNRAHGEGTIYRRADGLWCAQLLLPSGKRKSVYAKQRRAVVQKLAELQHDPTRVSTAGRSTVQQYMERWLDALRPSVRPTTHATYRSLVRCHVTPYIGADRLSRVSPLTLQRLYADLEAAGVSPRMRRHVHMLLHRALHQAVRWRLIRDNPADAVDRPRAPRTEIRALELEEVRRLLEAAQGDRLEALYVIALTCGLRQGELFALRWRDVDLRRRTLSVQRSLLDAAGERSIAEPKTAKGRRSVELPELAVEALRHHRVRCRATPHPETSVFADTRGGPLRRSNFLRRDWGPLKKRAGLEGVRFHDLRHTAASLLLSAGVHPKVVQERLGHATVSITLDTYSHVLGTLQRDAADKIDELLG